MDHGKDCAFIKALVAEREVASNGEQATSADADEEPNTADDAAEENDDAAEDEVTPKPKHERERPRRTCVSCRLLCSS